MMQRRSLIQKIIKTFLVFLYRVILIVRHYFRVYFRCIARSSTLKVFNSAVWRISRVLSSQCWSRQCGGGLRAYRRYWRAAKNTFRKGKRSLSLSKYAFTRCYPAPPTSGRIKNEIRILGYLLKGSQRAREHLEINMLHVTVITMNFAVHAAPSYLQ